MEVSAQEFRDIQALLRRLCGLVLTDDKTYLVRTRLEAVVKSHGCATFSEYLSKVLQLHSILMRDELVEALTTAETSFNRDGHPFDEFRRSILPELGQIVRQRRLAGFPMPQAPLWSAGCSTGQEPYSMAIAVHEFVRANPALALRTEHFPIFATDVSNKSLSMAREGRFLDRDLDRGLSSESRERYFRQQGAQWTAHESLRRMIEFQKLNLIDRLPNLSPFEVIFCRNVLIYFDSPTRQRLCDQFHKQLAPGGLLIVGAAESLYGLSTSFIPEQRGATTLYRKAAETMATA